MASKRAIRRKSCVRKKRYTNYLAAMRGIGRLRSRIAIDGMLTPYACKFCGGYHFGHPPAYIWHAIQKSYE